ncbi:hypothetical protein [Actinocrispum wychmicini]|uniref:Uncharacterized protein n=1 Tax=Actinocrispum wychmicini TaxID=1213861 RepID=A0A4R2K526_9PSEU|nr:hypothetical protein [Actinocrispum wychmicini]TCO64926.1 hypothetical protein EV192_101710 [Actinocrispum wychmicini]
MAAGNARHVIGQHEMDILAMIASGLTVDNMLATGPWSASEIGAVIRRHGLVVDEDGRVTAAASPVDQDVRDALASPSPLVRQQARRAYAQLVKLRKVQGMQAARDISDDLRRLQRKALQDWLGWLQAATAGARDELARLRGSSPRSTRTKAAAS